MLLRVVAVLIFFLAARKFGNAALVPRFQAAPLPALLFGFDTSAMIANEVLCYVRLQAYFCYT